jgi:hypothetical protein
MSAPETKEEMKEQLRQRSIFTRCQLKEVDGHIEAECESKQDRDELAALFEQEAILRVKPAAPKLEHEFTTVEELKNE